MSQEESLYDLLHSKRANALRNSEKFLAAVEYFKGREDIVQARMAYVKEKGEDALLTEDDFQRIIEESKKGKNMKHLKILVCEDDFQKYESIKDALSVISKSKLNFTFDIERAPNAKTGIIKLQNENFNFDFLICDMQMPFNNDEGISVDAGCRVLERVKMLCETNMKTTICSSDIKSRVLMEKMHLGEFHFIDFGSFEFINDLTEFIKNGLEETMPPNELNESNEPNK